MVKDYLTNSFSVTFSAFRNRTVSVSPLTQRNTAAQGQHSVTRGRCGSAVPPEVRQHKRRVTVEPLHKPFLPPIQSVSAIATDQDLSF
jgi:hypothetical protein